MNYRYIIGIDEVGRGPLAGPVTIGVVCIAADFDKNFRTFFRGIKDSKKLSAQKRFEWRTKALELKGRGDVTVAISSVGAFTIDRIGISKAIQRAIKQCLTRIAVDPNNCLVLLDGGLKAPWEYFYQKTIIKGDEKEPVIALASIFAKVHRDTKMERFAERFREYGFEEHKGYGTSEHIKKIRKHGLSEIHRRSFVKNILK